MEAGEWRHGERAATLVQSGPRRQQRATPRPASGHLPQLCWGRDPALSGQIRGADALGAGKLPNNVPAHAPPRALQIMAANSFDSSAVLARVA